MFHLALRQFPHVARVFNLPREEMGMGRGWANVGRTCQEVTETVLAEAERGTETRSAVETPEAMLRGAARMPMQFSERTAALDGWLWHCSHNRRLSALGHRPPVLA